MVGVRRVMRASFGKDKGDGGGIVAPMTKGLAALIFHKV